MEHIHHLGEIISPDEEILKVLLGVPIDKAIPLVTPLPSKIETESLNIVSYIDSHFFSSVSMGMNVPIKDIIPFPIDNLLFFIFVIIRTYFYRWMKAKSKDHLRYFGKADAQVLSRSHQDTSVYRCSTFEVT